jgi:hypothetical protein
MQNINEHNSNGLIIICTPPSSSFLPLLYSTDSTGQTPTGIQRL